MNSSFNEWYIDVSIPPQEGQIEKRVACIENYASDISPDKIITLVRIYFGMPVEEEERKAFASVFTAIDPTFSVRYAEELALLAGAVLVEVTGQDNDYASLVELLSLTTLFYREPVSSNGILETITKQFNEHRISIRENNIDNQTVILAKALVSDFKNHIDQKQWDTEAPAKLLEVLNKCQKNFVALKKSIDSFQEAQRVHEEESQLLWWMMSEWSNTLNCQLKTLEKGCACLMLGWEAANFILNYPGPYAMEGIIAKVLSACKGKSETIELPDLIMKTNKTFKSNIVNEMKHSPLLDQLPLTNAIICSDNAEKADEWYPKYKREFITREDDICLPLSKYAWQMYLECMASRCYNALSES
ncbi:MAG: GTPase-associated system all-helical protein GASH [Agathobacter sp.]